MKKTVSRNEAGGIYDYSEKSEREKTIAGLIRLAEKSKSAVFSCKLVNVLVNKITIFLVSYLASVHKLLTFFEQELV